VDESWATHTLRKGVDASEQRLIGQLTTVMGEHNLLGPSVGLVVECTGEVVHTALRTGRSPRAERTLPISWTERSN